jgi:quinol monooxygenase YgiN
MAPVVLIGTMKARPEKRDELLAALDRIFEHTAEHEPGTAAYAMNVSAADPDVFCFYEVYRDQAAMDAHMSSEPFLAFSERMSELVEDGQLLFSGSLRRAKLGGAVHG